MFWQYRHIVYNIISNIPTHDCLCVTATQHSRFLFDLFKNIMIVSAALHLRSWSRSKWQKQHFLRSCSRKHIASIILPQHLNRFFFFLFFSPQPPHFTRHCGKSITPTWLDDHERGTVVNQQRWWNPSLWWGNRHSGKGIYFEVVTH